MDLVAKVTHAIIDRLGLFEFVQFWILGATVSLALLFPGAGSRVIARFEGRLRTLAARPLLSISVIVAVALVSRGVLLPIIGRSDPIAPDELSTILQAQTYMTGHLSNTIKLSPDFSSIYVLLHPSYASMYPALRSLPLFLGRVIGVGFAGGVWLSVVALCALTYWMLCAFVPRGYALVVALIVVARIAIFSWWVNSYFGPALTAAGGLLLIGGYARFVKDPRVIHGCALGFGVFLMMTTRPFEGLVISIPFACALLVHFARSAGPRRPALMMAAAGAAIFVVGGLGLTMVHNQAVTGNVRAAPYSFYRAQTATTPPFIFQKAKVQLQPDYMQERVWISLERLSFDHSRTLKGVLGSEASRFVNYFNFYIGFALLIPFAIGAWAFRRRPLICATGVLFGLCLTVETWVWSQYASAAFGLFMLAIAVGLQNLRRWRAGNRPVGLALSRWLPLGLLPGFALPLGYLLFGTPSFEAGKVSNLSSSCCWLNARTLHTAIAKTLERDPAKSIVIVDEGPPAPKFDLMVYNDADIAGSKTIWLNDDPRYNEATLSRFPDRKRWRLDWRTDGSACLRPLDGAVRGLGPAMTSQPCFGRFGDLVTAAGGILKVAPLLPLHG